MSSENSGHLSSPHCCGLRLKVSDLMHSIALQHNFALNQSYDQKDADNADDDKA